MLSIKIPKLQKTTAYLGWRIVSILTLAFLLASAVGSIYFIYLKIYRTLEDADTIAVLNFATVITVINQNSFDQARTLILLKNNASVPSSTLRNVFVPVPRPTPVASTTPRS
jgi:hypothetical protein